MRLYDPTTPHKVGPLSFRTYGPLRRFDHHPGLGAGRRRQPNDDAARGILYAGFTLSCCLVEIFGDTRLVSLDSWHVAEIEVTRDLRLLDLRGAGAMRAGTVAAIAATEHHDKAQEWSRRFYDDAMYAAPEGIRYPGAHNGEDVFAFYERAGNALRCPPTSTICLDDPLLRPDIERIMHEHLLNWSP